jgi:Ca2+-binding RTX toxin-like protein
MRNRTRGGGVFAGMKPRIRTAPHRIAVLAIAAGVPLVAIPAAANAAVTPSVAGTQLTLTGDATGDNVTLGVSNTGLITHNFGTGANGLANVTDFDPGPGIVTLPSDGTIGVTVNVLDGNDNVKLDAPLLAPSTVNAGNGDDVIVGTSAVDAISAGAGNDRITGFRGDETIHGDDGNDVVIWNNGDGNDTFEGDGGIDETLITEGNADDENTVTPSGAGFRFDRISPAPINVTSNNVEKLSLTSFSGNDKLTTAAGVSVGMNIDAGTGDDTIATGDGADLITGGDGNDTLSGAAGGDRIVGDRGGDTLNGGAADDTLVWNNGDGSDVMNGEDGVDRIETNLSAAADTSTLKVENGRVRYDRTNPGPFNLSIGTSEVFELNALGGDDTLTSTPGLPITVVADGGAGNDTLNVRDAVASFVFGGSGTDTAIADAQTVDSVAADVENVDRPAVVTPAAGAVTLAKTAKVKKGVATLKVSCPAGTAGCTGSVTLLTTKSLKAGKLKATLVLGRKSYALKAGETKSIKVKLASGTAKLAKKKKLAVSARVFNQGAVERSAKVTLSF